ncbi:MAG: glycerol kinase, partial [Deltaproteobacteria bacterium]|nr:glycerol kinase [Deltaproteobacteria bacterium]
VIRPTVIETTVLGAAYAAGLAVEFWKEEKELKANWSKDKEWKAKMPEDERAKLYKGWKKAVERSFGWV